MLRMSYETVSVRMNRSDPSIRWGFTLGRRGQDVVIARIEKDSLSAKAGLKEGDTVMSVCDRGALTLDEAQRHSDQAYLEITFHLKRHVSSHTCLPWTLTEKDNKLFVEEIPKGFATHNISSANQQHQQQQYSSSSTAQNQFNQQQRFGGQQQPQPAGGYSSQNKQSSYSHSESRGGSGAPWSSTIERNIPVQHQSGTSSTYRGSNITQQSSTATGGYQSGIAIPLGAPVHSPQQGQQGGNYRSSYSTETKSNFSSGGGGAPQPERQFHSPSSFASSMKNAGWNRDRQYQLSSNPIPNQHYSAAHFYNQNAAQGGQGAHPGQNGAPPQSYSFNNGATAVPFGMGSGGIPLNQQTFINTTSPIPLPHSSVSPGGTKVFYHSPSPRTRSQLSPNASIHHLQYNSPMNLYSTESCAEQFTQQTGQPVQTPSRTNTPAYLTSETKRLIEEGDALRGPSPSAQSSSFKRISQAVGAPVH